MERDRAVCLIKIVAHLKRFCSVCWHAVIGLSPTCIQNLLVIASHCLSVQFLPGFRSAMHCCCYRSVLSRCRSILNRCIQQWLSRPVNHFSKMSMTVVIFHLYGLYIQGTARLQMRHRDRTVPHNSWLTAQLVSWPVTRLATLLAEQFMRISDIFMLSVNGKLAENPLVSKIAFTFTNVVAYYLC
jgi:hypothetical protein